MMFFDVVFFSDVVMMGRRHEMCPQATMPGG
jgi:hypothetical protein